MAGFKVRIRGSYRPRQEGHHTSEVSILSFAMGLAASLSFTTCWEAKVRVRVGVMGVMSWSTGTCRLAYNAVAAQKGTCVKVKLTKM